MDLCGKALEAVGHGVMIAEAGGDMSIVYVNPAFEHLTGYSADAVLNRSCRILDGEESGQDGLADLKTAIVAGESRHVVLRQYRRDGTAFMNHLSLSPMRDEGDEISHLMVVMEDASERIRHQEQRIAEAEAQRDMLVREVHHRIKNSLQGVSGLLARHAYMHPELADILREACAQVNAIAIVHGLQGRASRTDLDLLELVEAIVETARGGGAMSIETRVEAGPDGGAWAKVRGDTGVAVALIINELIRNAQKHGAFGDGRGIDVTVRCDAAGTYVEVANSGTLPAGFDLQNGHGLGTGLELVRSMLPHKTATLGISEHAGRVVAALRLSAPVAA
ncbi:MAG: PAS domain-containing protein [Gammaproteobacteria bacterium]|nr:PAS domain-containing protein [Gammaproteobacteria bacterium]